MYGLNIERDQQNRLADELFSPISGQIQPESIEARIALYEKRLLLEEDKNPYKIVKQRFLNWRLSMGILRIRKEIVPAHFLPYSTLKSEYTRGKIDYKTEDLHHMNRDEVKFISLATYNRVVNTDFTSVKALIFNPPSFDTELGIRAKLGISAYDLSAVLVVEEIPSNKIEILLQSKTYTDVQEVLIEL
jgi:hypothetical protein